MPNDTKLTQSDNPQDVIDQVLGKPPEDESVNIQEKEIEAPQEVETELLTPPATPIPPLPESTPPTPPPLTTHIPEPRTPTPMAEDVPLAFAGVNPTAPVLEATKEPIMVTKNTDPVEVRPTKMVEPKKKKGKGKVVGIVVGILILLTAVLGGLYGYVSITGEPSIIAYIIEGVDHTGPPTDQCEGVICGGKCCGKNQECKGGKCKSPVVEVPTEENNDDYQSGNDVKDGSCLPPGGDCEKGRSYFDDKCAVTETRCGWDPNNDHTYVDGVGDVTGEEILPPGVVKKCPDNDAAMVTFWCPGENWESDPVHGGCTQNRGSLPPGASYNYTDASTCSITGRFCGATQIDDASGASISKTDNYGCDAEPTLPPETTTLSCTSLIKDIVAPSIGDEVTFTCAGSVVPAGSVGLAYDFRYRRDSGEWFDLTTNGEKTAFTIALTGEYEVQCRACGTIDNASVCDPTWIGASQ